MAKGDKKAKPASAPAAPTTADMMAMLQSGDLSALGIAATAAPTFGAPRTFIEAQQAAGLLPAGFKPWESGQEWEPSFGWSPEDQARVKAIMAGAGLYGREGYRAGGWDRNDANALQQVLEFANGRGIDSINRAVSEFASFSRVYGGAVNAPREPLVTRLANPAAVRQVVRKSALELLGQRLSDDEEERLVSGFQAQLVASQQAAYAAEPGGGAVVEPLSAEEYTEEALQNKPQAGAQRYLDAFKEIHRSMTSTVTPMGRTTQGGGVQY